MKKETQLVKTGESNVVRFQSKLDELPGWNTLDVKTQGLLYEVKQNIFQRQRLRILGEFGDLMDIHRAETALAGKEVNIRDFLRDIYPDIDDTSITRKLQVFRKLVSTIPTKALEATMTLDSETLSHFERIAKARLGDILAAANELPQLPIQSNKEAAQYLAELDEKIKEVRSKVSHKGKEIMDKREAQKMVANAIIHYAHACAIKTSSQALGFIQTTVGWAMESLAVHGVIRIKRLPVPDGVIIRRGRPRMTEEEKRKAKEAREALKKGIRSS